MHGMVTLRMHVNLDGSVKVSNGPGDTPDTPYVTVLLMLLMLLMLLSVNS